MVKKATIDISDSCNSQPVIVVDPQSQRSVQPVCTCSGSTDEAGLQLLLTIFKFKFSHFKCLRKRKLAQKKLFKIEPSPTSSQCPTSTPGSPSLQTWSSNNRYQDYTITLFFFSHLQCLETILRQEVHSPIWIPVHLHLPLQRASALPHEAHQLQLVHIERALLVLHIGFSLIPLAPLKDHLQSTDTGGARFWSAQLFSSGQNSQRTSWYVTNYLVFLKQAADAGFCTFWSDAGLLLLPPQSVETSQSNPMLWFKSPPLSAVAVYLL